MNKIVKILLYLLLAPALAFGFWEILAIAVIFFFFGDYIPNSWMWPMFILSIILSFLTVRSLLNNKSKKDNL